MLSPNKKDDESFFVWVGSEGGCYVVEILWKLFMFEGHLVVPEMLFVSTLSVNRVLNVTWPYSYLPRLVSQPSKFLKKYFHCDLYLK